MNDYGVIGMRRRLIVADGGRLVAPLFFLAAIANVVPTIDMPSMCRREMTGIPSAQQAGVYQTCIHDEQAALKELREKWPQFPSDVRRTCAEMGTLVGSYIEVLVCIRIDAGLTAGEPASVQPTAPNATRQRP